MPRESTRRYLSTPRECIGCGGVPAAAMPRCLDCHRLYIQDQNEGVIGDCAGQGPLEEPRDTPLTTGMHGQIDEGRRV